MYALTSMLYTIWYAIKRCRFDAELAVQVQRNQATMASSQKPSKCYR